MKKIVVSMIVILILIASITTVTFAWFTYAERKSIATFEAGELSITTQANDQTLNFNLELDDLAFIDYQNEVVMDKYQTFNHMASATKLEIKTNSNSPLSKHLVSIDETNLQNGLMYFLIYEGYNIDETYILESDYHAYLTFIIVGLQTKSEQLNALKLHNQSVLDAMYNQIMLPDETLTFQIVCWGDYDALDNPSTYLDEVFTLSLVIDSINAKGELN